MIDFACKQFSIKEVIKCGLGFTKADFKIFDYLSSNLGVSFTTEEIAKKLFLNLSTVQRGVKKLYLQEVVFRNQENLDNGGYIFVYQAKSKAALRKIILDVVKSWSNRVETELSKW